MYDERPKLLKCCESSVEVWLLLMQQCESEVVLANVLDLFNDFVVDVISRIPFWLPRLIYFPPFQCIMQIENLILI